MRDVGAGVWLLLAAAGDARIRKVWFDKTSHSPRAAFENPLHRNLHEAIIPGFALRWDLEDLVSAMGERPVLWSDPADWMGSVVSLGEGYRYRVMGEPDDSLVEEFLEN